MIQIAQNIESCRRYYINIKYNKSQINLEMAHMPRMEQGIGTDQLGY